MVAIVAQLKYERGEFTDLKLPPQQDMNFDFCRVYSSISNIFRHFSIVFSFLNLSKTFHYSKTFSLKFLDYSLKIQFYHIIHIHFTKNPFSPFSIMSGTAL